VRTPGPWIGAAADVSRTLIDTGHRLDPGDIVVLYTDGITEAMNDEREQFGIERLCDVIEKNRAESVDAIRDRIFDAVEGFMAEQDDDMSVVVMRFVG
jgi:sigma-B regulation protein RsbU (phosphoserine phosphatase)